MVGERAIELTRLFLGDGTVLRAGGGGDRRSVSLRVAVLGHLSGFERRLVCRAHGIVGLALDRASKRGGKRAFAGCEHHGLTVERMAL